MDETARKTTNDDKDESAAARRSGNEILSALRRAASGLEANLREAARLLRRGGPSSDIAA